MVDYNLRSLYHPSEYPPASAKRYIKNFLIEYMYIVAKFLVWPFFAKMDLTVNRDKQSDHAILLVHGYCRNQSDWLWMRKQLKSLNCPIYFVNLLPLLGSIQDIATNSLPAKINDIKRQTKCKNLIIIAHSMGGLVSNYYSEFMDPENFVQTVISIGTPFYGSKIAVAGAGENGRQMCPGSVFLAQLRASLLKSRKKYYQICSKFDNKIFPWQSALFEYTPKERQRVFAFEAHLCMLHSKPVVEQLRNWILELTINKSG